VPWKREVAYDGIVVHNVFKGGLDEFQDDIAAVGFKEDGIGVVDGGEPEGGVNGSHPVLASGDGYGAGYNR
jgi:hypothetical protein